jgi:diguanylate cyclase (GGDEF)-like protein
MRLLDPLLSLVDSHDNAWRPFITNTSFVVVLITLGVFFGTFVNTTQLIESELRTRARAHFDDIVLVRRWNTRHGGVFAEKTEGVESNPYLRDPDVETIKGTTYTMKNPALMTREVSRLSEQNKEHSFRITSLKPVNPDNRPDPFELKALESFEAGNLEEFWKEAVGERTYFRYMAPLFVEEECLPCHSEQGYKVGEVRGGISVKFDISEVEASLGRSRYVIILLFFLTSIVMLSAIYLFTLQLSRKLKTALDRIRKMAVTDELTALFNRRHYFDQLSTEMDRAKRYGHEMSCVILDLDFFKKVNDEYGHPAGDSVLREVADILKSTCRTADTVARIGGEEFVVILPETGIDGALRTAEKIRSEIERTPIVIDGDTEIRVTASLGVASLPRGGIQGIEDEFEITKIADQALYRAKENGRNRVETAAID